MQSWWAPLGVFTLIFLGKPLLLNLRVFHRLRALRFSLPDFRTIPREETPPATASVFRSVEEELLGLGFQFECALRQVPTPGASPEATTWQYVHPETGVVAALGKLQLINGTLPRCSFKSILHDGRLLLTSPDSFANDSTETTLENRVPEVPLKLQYRAHLDFVERLSPGRPALHLTPEEKAAFRTRIWKESMQWRERHGQVFQVGEDLYACTLPEAVRRTLAAGAQVRRLNRSQPAQASMQKVRAARAVTDGVSEEVEQFREIERQAQSTTLGWVSKLALLVLSMGLFMLAFRLTLSWQSVLLLMGVLTFHEGGHLLGMRIFGYTNLQMLYLPFLGAVAIGGKRHDIRPWQELVVLFLGPLPGFAMGLFVLVSPICARLPLRHEVGLMLLALNLFNLLPIHPLDGGQIWDILFFRRFPFGRVLFLGLSAIAFLVAGATGAFGTAFVVLGALFLLQLPSQLRQARILRSLRKQFGAELSQVGEDTLVPAIFEILQSRFSKLKFALKVACVRGVRAQCKVVPAGLGAFIFGIVAYSMPLCLGVIALVAHHRQNHARAEAELAQARAEGLLETPPTLMADDRIDATPFATQLRDLLKQSDARQKLQAIQSQSAETNPPWKEMQQALGDPEVASVLALARKVAEGDFIQSDPERVPPKISMTRWLALSAECAAGGGEAGAAWSELESALRCARLKTVVEATPWPRRTEDGSLPTALHGLRGVMALLSPPPEEIVRLRDLLQAGRLAQPILAARLSYDIGMIKFAAGEAAPKSSAGAIRRDFARPVRSPELSFLPEIRELKRRWELATANPDAPEEQVFGIPQGRDRAVLSLLRLARAALALNEYRLAHGSLPADLAAVESLTVEQRDTLTWDASTNRLEAKQPRREIELSDSPHTARSVAKDESDQSDQSDEGPSPFIWTIR